ncbi:MAG: hypothetical protein ACI8PZ_002288 [Myxococcota bacterium]|jgi:hypothetical protein
MERAEAERRDRVMRVYFDGKDWDRNDEFALKRDLVRRSHDLLPHHPFLVEDEWDVVSGHTNHGRGDLVFTDGEGRFAVVEVKYINLTSSGATARRRRTKCRRQVHQQAQAYAAVIRDRHDAVGPVLAFAYTNERPDTLVAVVWEAAPADAEAAPADAVAEACEVPELALFQLDPLQPAEE